MRLAGKNAILVASPNAVGREIARHFVREGARLLLCAPFAEKLDGLIPSLRDLGGQAEVYPVGPMLPEPLEDAVHSALRTLVQEGHQCHISAFAVERFEPGGCAETSSAALDATLMLNVVAPAYCIGRVAPWMRRQRSGAVVLLSSVFGMVSGSGSCAFEAAAGVQQNLVRSLAQRYAGEGVRCNAVCPGWIDSDDAAAGFPPVVRRDGGPGRAEVIRRTPMLRGSTPQEIAQAFVYLASDESSGVTGHTLVLDGGLLAR